MMRDVLLAMALLPLPPHAGQQCRSSHRLAVAAQIAARAAGQQLPFAEVYARMLEACVARGEGDWDNAVIVEAIARCGSAEC